MYYDYIVENYKYNIKRKIIEKILNMEDKYIYEETLFSPSNKNFINNLKIAYKVRKINMLEGEISQMIIGDFIGWENLKTGHESGLDCYNKDRKIYSKQDAMKGAYLGPEFSNIEIENALNECGAVYIKLSHNNLIDEVASKLENGKVIGWMQGRMEFGPRALGGRSIIADSRSPLMQKQLNLKIKYRESFRPFAPSVLFSEVNEWFEHDTASPYMLFVTNIQKKKRLVTTAEEDSLFGIDKLNIARSLVPAITHVDYSARIQTVHAETNSHYHALISKFKEKTGCPIIVNTSFNIRGEPIVCTPTDAFKCFMSTELDILVVGNYLLLKEDQNKSLQNNYKKNYELD